MESIETNSFQNVSEIKIVYIKSPKIAKEQIVQIFSLPEVFCLDASIEEIPQSLYEYGYYPNRSTAVRDGVLYNSFYNTHHAHSFDRMVEHEMYAVSEENSPGFYYFSCLCGEKGNLQFLKEDNGEIVTATDVSETTERVETVETESISETVETEMSDVEQGENKQQQKDNFSFLVVFLFVILFLAVIALAALVVVIILANRKS